MILLTKDNCRYCTEFKNFLEFSPTGKQHAHKVVILKQEECNKTEANKDYFSKKLNGAIRQGAASFPILLSEKGDSVLMTGFNPTLAVRVLTEND